MKTFKQFLAELKLSELRRDNAVVPRLVELLEHNVYKVIPGTRNSYREDSGNTNTLTDRHSHVYAKMGGKGSELYAVNVNGRGHDGSSGRQIPPAHADFFREKGYRVRPDNILESLDVEELVEDQALIILLDDEPHTLVG